uniref:Uncharacterized protein n=1 Tax=Mus musculus TaxID=10090 RepID=Q8CEI4_MOUSE|nr:unnamed protein product [Mus musculus]
MGGLARSAGRTQVAPLPRVTLLAALPSWRGRGQPRSAGPTVTLTGVARGGQRGVPDRRDQGNRAHRTVPKARPPARPSDLIPFGLLRLGTRRMRAVPGPAPQGSPSPAAPRTFDHVAVDGGAELLARALVEVLAVDDPHLLQEGGLAALARAQQQDLHQPLHPPKKPSLSCR